MLPGIALPARARMRAACGADAPVGLDEREDFPEPGAQPTRPRHRRWCAQHGAEDTPELGGGSGEGPMLRQATRPAGLVAGRHPAPAPAPIAGPGRVRRATVPVRGGSSGGHRPRGRRPPGARALRSGSSLRALRQEVDRSTRTCRDPETATRTACPCRPSRDWMLCRLESRAGGNPPAHRAAHAPDPRGFGSPPRVAGGSGRAQTDRFTRSTGTTTGRAEKSSTSSSASSLVPPSTSISPRLLASGRVSRPATSSMNVRNAVFTTRSGAAADPSASSSRPRRTSAVITWSSKWISKVRRTSVAAWGRNAPFKA